MPDDRDTHFSGFAKLLMEQMLSEVDVEIVTSFGWREDWEAIIAQRAYDFACHLASNVSTSHIGLMRAGLENVEQCVDAIPDLTELPRGEK